MDLIQCTLFLEKALKDYVFPSLPNLSIYGICGFRFIYMCVRYLLYNVQGCCIHCFHKYFLHKLLFSVICSKKRHHYHAPLIQVSMLIFVRTSAKCLLSEVNIGNCLKLSEAIGPSISVLSLLTESVCSEYIPSPSWKCGE